MEAKLIKAIAVLAVTACFVMMAVVVIYAWYAHFDDGIANGNMGEVIVSVSEAVKLEAKDAGVADFTISNDSNIDIYMRLGWTPIYKDANGKELTTDISGISVAGAEILGAYNSSSELYGITPVAEEIQSINGYIKNMLELTDGSGNYFVIPAGSDIEIRITMSMASRLKPGEYLYISVVPEALQATKKAVAAAASYGWDETKAFKQARTVVTEMIGGVTYEAD